VLDGRAEHAHRRVADELVERAPNRTIASCARSWNGNERPADVFGVGGVRPLGESDQIGEQDRHGSRSAVDATASDAPQAIQKRAAAGFSVPHEGHVTIALSLSSCLRTVPGGHP
jgi:hypothetical protein